MEAIAYRLEAIAIQLEAKAIGLEAIAIRNKEKHKNRSSIVPGRLVPQCADGRTVKAT